MNTEQELTIMRQALCQIIALSNAEHPAPGIGIPLHESMAQIARDAHIEIIEGFTQEQARRAEINSELEEQRRLVRVADAKTKTMVESIRCSLDAIEGNPPPSLRSVPHVTLIDNVIAAANHLRSARYSRNMAKEKIKRLTEELG